jgi:hypothetical protein
MVSLFLSQAETTAARSAGLLGQLGWVLLGLIVVAFLVFGLRDVARLSWARISAISSVSFAESIRRRVLWITPLAILGAVVVSQLQNAVDPQDAIRQTTKICLFASGLVVVLVGIIVASTNLQKEIDTRVIYTIVTKPTTRLEIVLGKVWGFAKVSAAILLIMGLFTYAYLHVNAARLGAVVNSTLQTLKPTDASYDTLQHYSQAGLLNAKAMAQPEWMQMLSRPPVEGEPLWTAGGQGQQFRVEFRLDSEQDYPIVVDAVKNGGRVALVVDMPTTSRAPTTQEWETIKQTAIPVLGEAPSDATTNPTTAPAGRPTPVIDIEVRNASGDYLVNPGELNKGAPIELSNGSVSVPLPLETVDKLFFEDTFVVYVKGRSPSIEYGVVKKPVHLQVLDAKDQPVARFDPVEEPGGPRVSGSIGRFGQQLYGGAEGVGGLAVYRFSDVRPGRASGEHLTFEVKAGIERGGEGLDEADTLPVIELRVRDVKTGQLSEPFTFRPETNRISYIKVPRAAIPEGEFDVLLRSVTPDRWLGVQPDSVALSTGSRVFAFNLAKSFFILWLLSVLVITIALFCSTFVSWPIAVVLTLVILLGRWGVEQIGDAGGPGIGAVVSGQTQDPRAAKVMRETVNFLSRTLTVVAAFLPDISGFQATADIERGISVPLDRLARAGWALLGYGLPMVILAYLILKRKEVAP